MLAKEDVLLWFKDLESYKRIDVMYELLNMCIPFEIRFLGSCIEEIGKHTYQELRGPSIAANSVERLEKDAALAAGGLGDEGARHRAIIYMSVLSARNCTCANWYYRTLLRPAEPVERVVRALTAREDAAGGGGVISELLLFYMLGLYHPAFTFEQKAHFKRALDTLLAHCRAMNGRAAVPAAAVAAAPEAVMPPIVRNVSSHIESNQPVVVPVKNPSTMPVETMIVSPHGMPQNVPPKMQNFLFPSGPPEARPFPAQSSKPAQGAPRRDNSPPQSPLPMGISQSPGHVHPPPLPLLEAVTVPPPPLHLDSNLVSAAQLMPFVHPPDHLAKNIDDENHFISEDKPWQSNEIAKQNGIRFNKNYYHEFANLKLDAATPESKPPLALHGSNSNSSSSSRNQSPTETPSVTPAVTPHGPGRGPLPPQQAQQQQQQPPPPQLPPPDAKPRVNGMPPPPQALRHLAPAPPPPCDAAAAAAPPPPPYNVPSFPGYPPTRYFPIRHPFTTHSYLPPSDYFFSPHVYYSSVPQPARNPNCCNCGAMGHTSVDCTSQSVENLTQTPYALDFDSPTVPDNPPEK